MRERLDISSAIIVDVAVRFAARRFGADLDNEWEFEMRPKRNECPMEKRQRLLREVLLAQKRAFRRKFGRNPKPGDPIFFDPDAAEPAMLSHHQAEELLVRSLRVANAPAPFIYAYKKTGLLVTDENIDRLKMDQLKRWDQAVAEYFKLEREAMGTTADAALH